MFFDIITLSSKRDSIILKKLNKHYEKNCNFRNCITHLEIKKCIKERFPDILLLIIEDEKINKNDDKFLEQILSKYQNMYIILCANDNKFLNKQINLSKRIFLEIEFFEKNYDFILNFLFENINNKNIKKYKNHPYIFNEIIGNSIPARELQKNIKQSSNNKAKILLTGETGNEYEDIAFLIHKNSNRKRYNFASYDISLNQKEGLKKIFGFVENRQITVKSLLEYTYNGTILIKNIHLLGKEDKERFILFLRSGSFSRLNSKNKLKTNNRIITYIPSNEIEGFLSNSLNKELYDRFSTETFEIPSLKKRKEDFVILCSYLIEKICKKFGCKNEISSDTILKLSYFDWEGNTDELYFYLKLLVKNSSNGQTDIFEKNTNELSQNIYNKNLKKAKQDFEIDYIKKQLERFGGHITNTAKFIGMNRIALHKKIKDLGIRLDK